MVDSDLSKKHDQSMYMYVYVIIWYLSSIVCTNTTKSLSILGYSPNMITLLQLSIAAMFSIIFLFVLKLKPFKPIRTVTDFFLYLKLTISFVIGFITLNAALKVMHVSLVMVFRAGESICTFMVIKALLPSEPGGIRSLLSLIPVVVGAALSAAESTDTTIYGVFLCCVCNLAFGFRNYFTKILKKKIESADDYNVFFHICWIGTIIQGFVISVEFFYFQVSSQSPDLNLYNSDILGSIILNGFTFWLYLQMSFIVLGMVPAVTHSVMNSMRRPVICFFGFLQFGGDLSPLNLFGIVLSSGGALLYGNVQVLESAAVVAAGAAAANSTLKSKSTSTSV